jgi:hypothetical protein
MTSYVSANAAAMGGLVTSGAITETREIYAGAWLVTGSVPTETKGWTDFVEYVKVMTLYAKSQGETLIPATDPIYGALIAYYFAGMDWAADGVSSYWLNSYGMAGYVSANVFCQGLSRMSGKDLRWGDYVLAMEEELVNVPMGTAVDYREGKRVGIDSLAVNRYTVANAAAGGEVYRAITDLATLEAAING